MAWSGRREGGCLRVLRAHLRAAIAAAGAVLRATGSSVMARGLLGAFGLLLEDGGRYCR
jgi:hypothetical protein